jgi:hypothetical protein
VWCDTAAIAAPVTVWWFWFPFFCRDMDGPLRRISEDSDEGLALRRRKQPPPSAGAESAGAGAGAEEAVAAFVCKEPLRAALAPRRACCAYGYARTRLCPFIAASPVVNGGAEAEGQPSIDDGGSERGSGLQGPAAARSSCVACRDRTYTGVTCVGKHAHVYHRVRAGVCVCVWHATQWAACAGGARRCAPRARRRTCSPSPRPASKP